MLAWMVASEFTSDAAIQFKLGHRATEATEFESVNDSLGGPAPEFESDGCIRCKLGCDHPSQLFWQCEDRQMGIQMIKQKLNSLCPHYQL
ncbi:hypothetical protein PCASD_20938 [Puccinia coronata f. sp. avenae]|uniref:Uncharacterized protein n=1 Tax=Puccinia coronata f. sp. avenae TaxID=200324 RepID=A0A2N5TPE5_9BASI|nr:hypothetical protein PCASD_20938 [Puccinia coronata f. sp. avenae]